MKQFINRHRARGVVRVLTAPAPRQRAASAAWAAVMLMAMCIGAVNASAQDYVYHCDEDERLAAAAVEAARATGGNAGVRALAAAKTFIGMPYGDDSRFDSISGPAIIDLHTVGEQEFVESALAAAKASYDTSAPAERGFAEALISIRYRKGVNDGFVSRMRYLSDWVVDNVYRGNMTDLTARMPNNLHTVRTLDRITRNRADYPALADDETYERMKMFEMSYRAHKIPYLKRESAGKKQTTGMMREGDIVVILCRDSSYDMEDMGLIEMRDGKPYMTHVSRRKGKVVAEDQPLERYFRHEAQSVPGYRLLRPE